MTIIIILGWIAVSGWCYLAFWHGQFWDPLLPEQSDPPASWPSVDIIIPARNEAAMFPKTLPSLLKQDYPGEWHVYIVDDHSQDGTGDVVEKLSAGNAERVTILTAPDLPGGWSGKVAAMNAGTAYSRADYIMFTDADIFHSRNNLRLLVARATHHQYDLVSLMVRLHCLSWAEKLLIPAFIFYFSMLYPFRQVSDPQSGTAAAAGGVMLLRRQALDNIGGLESIKSALIDDCTLAQAIKKSGGPKKSQGHVALTLTQDVVSLRSYPAVRDIWDMVSRTAYTQLKYSPLSLFSTAIGMSILYLLPIVLVVSCLGASAITGFAVWVLMAVLYMPTVLFYGLSAWWSLSLPFAAFIYILATLDSARLYYRGRGGFWKGRSQA